MREKVKKPRAVDFRGVSAITWSMPLLVANWKMNGTRALAMEYASQIHAALETAAPQINVVFCPPFPHIAAAKAGLPAVSRLKLGAQNCHEKHDGAFTGEVSSVMLKDWGCSHVILGHSERRAMGETDGEILRKASAVIAAGMTPVICVGEQEKDYEKSHTIKVLDGQIMGLKVLPAGSYAVAYEPVWAIGSGKTPKISEIAAAHQHIKSTLGSFIPVLYGGSVKPANLKEILRTEGVNGALIGGASLKAEEMKSLIMMAGDVT